jgi:hypothetical protein
VDKDPSSTGIVSRLLQKASLFHAYQSLERLYLEYLRYKGRETIVHQRPLKPSAYLNHTQIGIEQDISRVHNAC